ncbi:MAG: alanine--tRNA ligase [Phytoplasma sp.]|uniref:alanine--tRNA ligase n=1 Tax=Phytoplasma sp. TaxID=2155 RepID=UPI002B4006A3|nr:alanine--tRNA ligase [Phytoplasma sp.]WRH06757.1 MAG: alanine--tRNA ligase [Phytoplasma sp.]
MKKMTSSEIRKMWLNFFITKGHHLEESASLIPDSSDTSLLWVNAGVVPFKKYFEGSEKSFSSKIVSIQKCLRTNDIESVGKTCIHHTFFEMLGNFSIGDYFKKEAIDLAYELLISEEWFALSQDKLYITYFDTDSMTYELWLKKGIDSNHLIPLKTNFWEIGEGPCGPCTEIFFDRGIKYDKRGLELILEDIQNDRFIEIWNLVFSQYNSESGKNRKDYLELPSKNIDTGAGLERLACVLQETETNFETDLFLPIIKQIIILSQIEYAQSPENFRIITDHIRTLVFGIGDGVVLTNEGRGYILKKLLRRSFLKGKILGFRKPFLFKLVSTVVDTMKELYPYLVQKKDIIQNIILSEEEKFVFNLKKSKKLFFKLVHNKILSGSNFFKLYDTYGLPKDMILEYARENSIYINEQEFQFFLEQQKTLSRGKKNIQHNMKKQNELFLNFVEKSNFVGYTKYRVKTRVLKIFSEGIVLEQTPFYPEMGGQIFDSGTIDDLEVTKVIKLPNNQILHQFHNLNTLFNDFFYEGKKVIASIDFLNRQKISKNHTATHLLYDSLQLILGDHVKQRGSSLGPHSLRLDFNHFQHLSFEYLIQIENKVKEWIEKKYPVNINEISFSEAKKSKVHFLDNQIYQDKVRIVQIGDISSQLCGGTHVLNTIDLRNFAILDYKIIGSGIHRIEAASGTNISDVLLKKLEPYLLEEKQILTQIYQIKQYAVSKDVPISFNIISSPKKYKDSYLYIRNYKNYLQSLKQQLSELKQQILQKRKEQIIKESQKFIPEKIEKNLLIFIDEPEYNNVMLKHLLEHLFNKLQVDILCLCCKNQEQIVVLCKSILIHVGDFIHKINQKMKFKGGGNKKFGQLNINNIDKFNEFKNIWTDFL